MKSDLFILIYTSDKTWHLKKGKVVEWLENCDPIFEKEEHLIGPLDKNNKPTVSKSLCLRVCKGDVYREESQHIPSGFVHIEWHNSSKELISENQAREFWLKHLNENAPWEIVDKVEDTVATFICPKCHKVFHGKQRYLNDFPENGSHFLTCPACGKLMKVTVTVDVRYEVEG